MVLIPTTSTAPLENIRPGLNLQAPFPRLCDKNEKVHKRTTSSTIEITSEENLSLLKIVYKKTKRNRKQGQQTGKEEKKSCK